MTNNNNNNNNNKKSRNPIILGYDEASMIDGPVAAICTVVVEAQCNGR
jgi:hypothetical protein